MGVRCFTSSLGPRIPHMLRSAGCMHSMLVNTYSDAVDVFDGYYGSASTKNKTSCGWTENDIGESLSVSADMRLAMSKKAFLANPSNKQVLINLIAVDMPSTGITVEHSQGDADYIHVVCLLDYTWRPPDRPTPLKLSRITWTIPLYNHCSSCKLLVVVIPHRDLTGLERWLFVPNMQHCVEPADVFLSAKADIEKLGEMSHWLYMCVPHHSHWMMHVWRDSCKG